MNLVAAGVGGRSLSAAQFAWLTEFLHERTGIELKPGKEPMVMGRLDRRLRHHGFESYGEYFDLLASGDPLETTMAIDLLTTNETYFFREPKHFEFLETTFGRMTPRGAPVRVWSAASSSGEEAYTIAMTLASCLPTGQSWEVFGTDISTRVLETARRAMYPIEAADKIPRDLLRAYCLKGRDEFEGFLGIDRAVRSRVTFRQANLIALPADVGVFDVIFLRNVMIYFNNDTKRELVHQLTRRLRPGGFFIISHAETLAGIQDPELVAVQPSVFQRGGGDG